MALFVVVCLFIVAGCSGRMTVSGKDGEKVELDGSGSARVTDKEGNTVDMKVGEGKFEAKSSDGTEMTVDEGGMRGKNQEGETYSVGADTVTEDELGVPYYPGSNALEKRDMKIQGTDEDTVLSVRSTVDAPEKVIEFYKSKVQEPNTMTATGMATLSGKLEDGRELIVVATVEQGTTQIQVTCKKEKK